MELYRELSFGLYCFPMSSKHLESTSLKFILLRCRALQLLPAKIINVCELLCLPFGPQFVEQVFLRQWLREHLPCASGATSQHEQRELPSPLTLQAVSHYPHAVLPSYLAETSILGLFVIMKRGGEKTHQVREWRIQVMAVELTVFMCLPLSAFAWLLNPLYVTTLDYKIWKQCQARKFTGIHTFSWAIAGSWAREIFRI